MIKILYYFLLVSFLGFFPLHSFAMKLNYYDKDIKDVLADTIKILLSWTGGIALLFLIIGGIIYITSGANPELQQKAKKAITYSVIGLMLILSSYAIIIVIENMVV
ncbi:hypothetical protein KAJ41_00860 [Candidatus Parcubacteria bacterium]|nr:hypothetical protein [Candidatus Parcubacteria bacterium]